VIWYCGERDAILLPPCSYLHNRSVAFCAALSLSLYQHHSDLLPGSSRGRGNRAAAWFADYIDEQHDTTMQSLVLAEGIKAWAAEKGEFVQYMQEYDKSKWQ
jgi:hypothetical protein